MKTAHMKSLMATALLASLVAGGGSSLAQDTHGGQHGGAGRDAVIDPGTGN